MPDLPNKDRPRRAVLARQAMTWTGARRLPADWSRRRRVVLRRDGNRCTWTEHGVRCAAKATDVHHAIHRDDHRIEALVSLCDDHHQAITNTQAAAARLTTRHPAEQHPGVKPEEAP